jgi:hypothetical protein
MPERHWSKKGADSSDSVSMGSSPMPNSCSMDAFSSIKLPECTGATGAGSQQLPQESFSSGSVAMSLVRQVPMNSFPWHLRRHITNNFQCMLSAKFCWPGRTPQQLRCHWLSHSPCVLQKDPDLRPRGFPPWMLYVSPMGGDCFYICNSDVL